MRLRRFLARHTIAVGFVAVLLPLAVLLGLQYGWLVDLQRKSAIAEKAYLRNYLDAVSSRIEWFYRTQTERGLNIPTSVISSGDPEKVAAYFDNKHIEGAKALFVSIPAENGERKLLLYDPQEHELRHELDRPTWQAIGLALVPWKNVKHFSCPMQADIVTVEERDPQNRILLRPIADDGCSSVIGIAGMIVDNDYFRDHVLPDAVDKSLPRFFDAGAMENLIVTVRDGSGRLVLGSPSDDKRAVEVTERMSFLYSDWKLALGTRYTTTEEWAKSNFLLNVSLSALLGVALLGGVVLALRTASREIRLSNMKSDFVSNISHELRTPLASIRVFGEFLRLGRVRDDEKIREYGEYIETESSRLTQLINNILDFSKIESGAKTYEIDDTDIEEIVGETVKTLEVGLRHKGFGLTFETPRTALPPLRTDPDAIAQAVANLVDNAVKYSREPGDIVVRLSRNDSTARISVIDEGVGISRDEQKKIFERFHRVSTNLVHDVKGSGLGLSIVNHIVRAHGGHVTVDSEPGRGSTFTIHLPIPDERAEGPRTDMAVPGARPIEEET